MTYRAFIYICASYLGHIDCKSWEFKKKPFSLQFYDKDGNIVGHVEPFGKLLARVDIYKKDDMSKRTEGWTLTKKCTFRNKEAYVHETHYGINSEKYRLSILGGK